MKESELQQAARIACGNAAASHGESTSEQWDELARWAGFDTWAELTDALTASPATCVSSAAHRCVLSATIIERGLAAAERRRLWESASAGRASGRGGRG